MNRKNRSKLVAAIAAMSGLVSSQHAVQAGTNGTWQGPSGGLWSSSVDWVTGAIAQGQGAIATFGTSGVTVNLDTNVGGVGTLGEFLINGGTWVMANDGNSANVFTLSTSSSQPIIDVLAGVTTFTGALSGTQGFILNPSISTAGTLVLAGADTGLSGNVVLDRGSLDVETSNAFGSASVTISPSIAGGADTNIVIPTAGNGINVPNNITMLSSNVGAGNNGSILAASGVTATFSGTITIDAVASSGGHFATSGGTGYLVFTGPIINTLSPNYGGVNNSGNAIIDRAGNLKLSGGGSYYRLDERVGTLQLGATNGIATDAILNLGGNNGANSVLDMNGFSQTLTAVGQEIVLAGSTTVGITNSSTSSPSVLTFAPNASNLVVTGPGGTAPSGYFVNVSFSGIISDASASFPLSIVENSLLNTTVNGTGTPVSTPNTSGMTTLAGANTYHGTTTLTAGTLAVSTLALGGVASGIGESSNAATNLVFGGGTLQYTGGNVTTDRSFTINAGTTGTINVSTAATTLTMTGGSAATSGSFIKSGSGTLVLSGSNLHTGTTAVNAGSLIVDGSLTSGSAVSIASGATLGGDALSNIAGTVTPAVGGIIAPGDPAVSSGIGTLNVGTLNLSTGSVVDFEFSTTPANDKISATNANLGGGSLNLYQVGTTTAFTTTGTYTLFSINNVNSGAFSNLSIANPQAGFSYALSNTGVLTIGNASISTWTGTTDNVWSDAANNWSPAGVPNAQSATVQFSGGGPANVTLSGPETVGAMIFSGANYSVSGSTLTLDNGSAAAPIKVSGQQAIASAISLNSDMQVTTSVSSDALTVSGSISGTKTLSVAGPGTVTLSANNSYGNTTVLGGTLNIGAFGGSSTTGSLGTGNLSLASGTTLNFNLVSPASYSFPGGIAGPGSVNQLGTGSTTVGGAISGTTTVNVSAGTLVASSTLDQSGGVNVTGGGALTVSGGITGAGALTVNTTGTVSVGGTSTYSGGTTLTAGALVLTGANAFPVSTSLAVNGGTLDLHGNSINISNIADLNSSTGVITNNAASSTTSTVTFSGNLANYNIYAALKDGINGGKVALVSSIANNNVATWLLRVNTAGTYSGGTTINSQVVAAEVTGALGTGAITIPGGNSAVNTSGVDVANGVTLANAITVGLPNAGAGLGSVGFDGTSGTGTISGTVTLNNDPFSGGDFAGPTTTGSLNVTGAVIAAGTATGISVGGGFVQFDTPSTGTLSSYPMLSTLGGTTNIGQTNGVLTTAILNAGAGSFDLAGFAQTVAGLQGTGIITDSGSQNTLTVNTGSVFNDVTNPETFAGSMTGFLALTKTGPGTLILTGSASTYFYGTTINQGVLGVSVLTNDTGSSSLGEPAFGGGGSSELVFSGNGTLRYVGTANTSTNYGFTINPGVTATIDVASAGASVDWTGSSPSPTSGTTNFTKAGAGTLIVDTSASWQHNGATTVSNGTLLVNGTMTSTSSISVASGAVLGGVGTIGSPTSTFNHTAGTITGGTVGGVGALNIGGSLTMNGGTALFDAVGSSGGASSGDLINVGGGFTFGSTPSTISLQFTNVSSVPSTAFSYELFTYNGSTPSGSPNFTYSSNLGRSALFSTNISTPGQIDVTITKGVSGPATIDWNSTSSGSWDVQTSQNWYNEANSNATDKFFQGDNVNFLDNNAHSSPANGQLQTNITIAAAVNPGSVTVNSNTNNYTFSGSFGIGGSGALTKSGNSTLTLSTSNSYSGGTNINGGLLSLTAIGSSGTLGTGTITFGGGTLQFSAFTAPAVDYSAQISTAANQPINIDTNGQSVTWATALSSSGGSLTKVGGGTLTLSGNNSLATINQNAGSMSLTGNNTLTGNLVVNGGTLTIPSETTAIVNTANGVNLNSGTLSFAAPSNLGTGTITFNGGTLGGAMGSSATALITNPIVVQSGGGTLSNSSNAFFSGTITGAGTFNSSTTNADVLTGAESSSGGTLTIVSNAQVNLVGNGTGSSTSSTSPTVAYVANAANGNAFVVGSGTPGPNDAGLLQLGSLSGVAGSAIRDANTAGVGPATFQIGALNTSTTFAGNIVDNANGNNTTAPTNIVSIVKVGSGTLTLSGTSSYTGTTTVSNGNLTYATVNTGIGARTLTGGLTVNSAAALTVASSTAVSGAYPNRTVLATSTLSNAGSIDLSSNDMIIHSGSGGEAIYGPLSTTGTISQEIAQGRGTNGLWTGTGATGGLITSSAAAAAPSNMALGSIVNDTNQSGTLSGTKIFSTFDGQTVADGDVLVKYTYYGDALLTGSVTAADYGQIDNAYNIDKTSPGTLTGWYNGDFNYDGVINGDDYTLIDNAYNTQGSVSFTGVSAGPADMIASNTDQIAGASVSAVPEPSTLSLLAIGAAGMLSRRRRKA